MPSVADEDIKHKKTRNQIDHVYHMSLTAVALEVAVHFVCLTVRKSKFPDGTAILSNGTHLSQYKEIVPK